MGFAIIPLIYTIADDALMFNYAYLDEKMGRAGQVGWYIVKVANVNNGATVSKAIEGRRLGRAEYMSRP